jgi:3-deoxy-D-manno-octulosonic-acid transferase
LVESLINKIDNRQSFLRLLYSAVLYILIPFVVLRLFFLSARNPAYRKRIHERFGFVQRPVSSQPVIWIHAVSVGEVHAAKPLVERIIRSYPHYQLLITTMTPTGAEAVHNHFGFRVLHYFIPYDLPGAVHRFILRIQPALLVVMETEIWPNLFYYCRRNNIPVVIANARMSEKSFTGYKRLSGLALDTLSNVSFVITQGKADAERLVALGADKSRVTVSGSIKFDIEFPEDIKKQGLLLRQNLFGNRPVWIAASTHAGEEKIILSAFGNILQQHPDCILILAPRHPERSNIIAELSDKSGFVTVRKSQGQKVDDQVKVYVLDTLGELPEYYAAADLAFVGGSLIPHGGHNMLEPAYLGIPVITGPNNHNFSEISTMLQRSGAAWIVMNAEELAHQVNLLLTDKNLRHDSGEKGRKLVEINRGSIHRLMEILLPYLNDNNSRN